MRLPDTLICTCTGPYLVSAGAPLTVFVVAAVRFGAGDGDGEGAGGAAATARRNGEGAAVGRTAVAAGDRGGAAAGDDAGDGAVLTVLSGGADSATTPTGAMPGASCAPAGADVLVW